MADFSNKFTTFESTDIPPVVTKDYEDIKARYESGFSLPIATAQQSSSRSISFVDDEQGNSNNGFKWTDEQEESYNPIQERTSSKSKERQIDSKSINGYSGFQQAMQKYEQESGDRMSPLKKKILSNIACLESGYKQKIKNNASSALGYFQMIKGNRKDLGSNEEFASSTNLQFQAASRLYDANWKMIQPYWKQGQALGLTPMQMMYGMWFNPTSMLKYIKSGGKEGGEFKDPQGTSFAKVLRRAASVS